MALLAPHALLASVSLERSKFPCWSLGAGSRNGSTTSTKPRLSIPNPTIAWPQLKYSYRVSPEIRHSFRCCPSPYSPFTSFDPKLASPGGESALCHADPLPKPKSRNLPTTYTPFIFSTKLSKGPERESLWQIKLAAGSSFYHPSGYWETRPSPCPQGLHDWQNHCNGAAGFVPVSSSSPPPLSTFIPCPSRSLSSQLQVKSLRPLQDFVPSFGNPSHVREFSVPLSIKTVIPTWPGCQLAKGAVWTLAVQWQWLIGGIRASWEPTWSSSFIARRMASAFASTFGMRNIRPISSGSTRCSEGIVCRDGLSILAAHRAGSPNLSREMAGRHPTKDPVPDLLLLTTTIWHI